MTLQGDAYRDGLGDDWYRRNKNDLGKTETDPVMELISRVNPKAINSILEVGCSNGWRLKRLREKRQSLWICGIDPSKEAIADAKEGRDGLFHVGTATKLPWEADTFDCVIMGFCMWALDPQEWFMAVAESDRVLKDDGLLIIHDRFTARPIKKGYPDRDDIFGYAYDWAKLWTAHPSYRELAEAMGVYPGTLTIEGAIMLQKRLDFGILTGVGSNG